MLPYFSGKRVLITGHTGFKGSWLTLLLSELGAEVTGYALSPGEEPSLFSMIGARAAARSVIGDIRDRAALLAAFRQARPEIVLHLAAQPIVRTSYREPAYTYEVNVMGTVNVLECVRQVPGVKSFVNVTTDKVYRNLEWEWGYRETDALDGFDPYSNSKSCSELVTHSYRRSFFGDGRVAVSTARAGNVIGGGDFAADRIVPDCVRAALARQPVPVRNPYSVRPYQHVLEPLTAYLRIAQAQAEAPALAGSYNVGPDDADCVSTGTLVGLFTEAWGEGMRWENRADPGAPHEAGFLKLDTGRIRQKLGWQPTWGIRRAVAETVAWAKASRDGQDMLEVSRRQIAQFGKEQEEHERHGDTGE